MIDTSDLITPATAEEDDALRESIRRYGQHKEILVAADGSIIDGNRRQRICRELGIEPAVKLLAEAVDDLTIEAYALLHNVETGRKPVPAERDRIVRALYDQGMSMSEIVSATGVGKSTVVKAVRGTACGPADHTQLSTPSKPTKPPPPKRIDSTGRAQAIRKTTPTEKARRGEMIADLYRRGHSTREIAEALDVGLGTVCAQLREIRAGDGKRYKGKGEITEPCLWRDSDNLPTRADTRWRLSRITGQARMLVEEFSEGNFANVLANQVTDAASAGDGAWLTEAKALVDTAMEMLERARRILTDPVYCTECRDTHEGLEQFRKGTTLLRAVR